MGEINKVYESEMVEVWNALLDAEMQTRYWRCCLQSKQGLDQWLKILVALLSSGTVASWMVWATNDAVWKSFSALAAAVAVIHPLLNLNRDIEEITAIYGKWVKLALDYDLLFQSLKDTDRKEILNGYKRLRATEVDIQERSVRLGVSESLKRKCFSEVCNARGLSDPLAKKGKIENVQ